jgi:hypothetical protein
MNDQRESRREVTTDSRGRYAFESIEDGLARVQVLTGGESNQRGVIRSLEVQGGGKYTIDLPVAAGTARLRGNVVDSAGRPLAGKIELQLVDVDELSRITNTRAIQGEAVEQEVNGSYDISGLPAGMCLIQFSVIDADTRGIVTMKMEGVQLSDGETTVHDFVMEKR